MLRAILLSVLMFLSPTIMAISYTVEISEAKLQQKVLAMMPMEKRSFIFTVTLSEPEIELIEGSNQIGVFTHIKIVIPGLVKGTGRAKIAGSLSYKSETSEFFFKDPSIEKLEIDKVPERYIPKVKKIVQKIASKILATRPIYKLKDDNLKHKLAKAMLKSVAVKDKKLLLEMSVL